MLIILLFLLLIDKNQVIQVFVQEVPADMWDYHVIKIIKLSRERKSMREFSIK